MAVNITLYLKSFASSFFNEMFIIYLNSLFTPRARQSHSQCTRLRLATPESFRHQAEPVTPPCSFSMNDLADLKAHLVGEERPRSHRLCQSKVLLIHPSPRRTPHMRGNACGLDGDGPGGMDGASECAGLCCHWTVCVTAAGTPSVTETSAG